MTGQLEEALNLCNLCKVNLFKTIENYNEFDNNAANFHNVIFFQPVSKGAKSTPKGKGESSDVSSSSSEDEQKQAKKGAKKSPVKSKKSVSNK